MLSLKNSLHFRCSFNFIIFCIPYLLKKFSFYDPSYVLIINLYVYTLALVSWQNPPDPRAHSPHKHVSLILTDTERNNFVLFDFFFGAIAFIGVRFGVVTNERLPEAISRA